MKATGRRRRRRKQISDDLQEEKGYWKLKEEARDGSPCRNRCSRDYGPVARHNGTNERVCSVHKSLMKSNIFYSFYDIIYLLFTPRHCYYLTPYSRMLRRVGNNEVKCISMNLSASSCDTINVFALKDCKMRRKTPVSAVIILSANVRGKCYALHDM